MVKKKSSIEIKLSRVIPVRKWKVLRMMTNVTHFPRLMPNVKKCEVIERFKGGTITAWHIEIDQIPLKWKQRDKFDFKNFAMSFKAIEGDLESFEGKWKLEDHPDGGTQVHLHVKASIGIPMLDQVIGHVVGSKIEKNFDMILSAMNETLIMRRYKNIADRKVSDIRGFAVIGHPYNFQHLVRYFRHFKPDFKTPSQEFLLKLFELTPSYRSFDIKNFKAKSGKTVSGYFIMCPIIPDMVLLNPDRVVEKVIEACRVAEQLGVGIATLGGFTSIAGERYNRSLTSIIHVPLTTGNTFTVAMVLQGLERAAKLMELDLEKAKITIIGGTGDIGGACARILCDTVKEITITSRSEKNLMEAERVLSYIGKAKIRSNRNNNEAIRGADIVLAAASTSNSIIDFNNFKSGAIICDVGYPKNISYTMCKRNDILIFSGGICEIPSEFDLGFDVGLPVKKVLYGCFAEAVLLDLEERYENFSWGKGNITKEKIDYINAVAKKHGFDLAPFFWGNRVVSEDDIRRIRANVKATV